MQRFLMFSISARLLSSSRPSQRSSLPSSLCSISFYLSAFCWTAQMWTPEKHICCVLLCVIPLFFSLCSYSFHRSPFPPLLCHLFVVFHFKPFCHLGQLYVLASSSLCDSSSFLWWKSAGHVSDDWQAAFSSSTLFQADSVWFMCPSSCLPEGHRARDKRCKQSSISSLSCVDVFITLLSDLCLLLCLSLCCASSVGLALSVFLLSFVIQPPSISHSAVFSPLSLPSWPSSLSIPCSLHLSGLLSWFISWSREWWVCFGKLCRTVNLFDPISAGVFDCLNSVIVAGDGSSFSWAATCPRVLTSHRLSIRRTKQLSLVLATVSKSESI